MNSLPTEIFLLIAQPILGATCWAFHDILSCRDNQNYCIKRYTTDSQIINSNKPFYIRFRIAKSSRPGWLRALLGGLPPTRVRRIVSQALSIVHTNNKVLVVDYVTSHIPIHDREALWRSIESDLPEPVIAHVWDKVQKLLQFDYIKQVDQTAKNQKNRNIQTLMSGLSGPAGSVFEFVITRSLQNYIDQPARAARRVRVQDIKNYLEYSS